MKGILQKGKELKKKKSSEGSHHPKVFGGTIDRLNPQIPPVMSKCISYLDKTGLEFEGIFRKSGSLAQMNEFKARFEKGEDVDLTDVLDPHIVAGLLKMYVRELAEPLLTFELYDVFLATVAIKDVSAKLPKLRQVLTFLPKSNLFVIKYLVEFLCRVSAKSDHNMMSPSNLAIVFAPNLLRPDLSGEEEIAAIMEDTPYSNELLQVFISHYHELFDGVSSEEVSQPKLVDSHSSSSNNGSSSPSSSSPILDLRKSANKPLPPLPSVEPVAATNNTPPAHANHTRNSSFEKPLPVPSARNSLAPSPTPNATPSHEPEQLFPTSLASNPFIANNSALSPPIAKPSPKPPHKTSSLNKISSVQSNTPSPPAKLSTHSNSASSFSSTSTVIIKPDASPKQTSPSTITSAHKAALEAATLKRPPGSAKPLPSTTPK